MFVDMGKDSDIEGLTQEESLMNVIGISSSEGGSDEDSKRSWWSQVVRRRRGS